MPENVFWLNVSVENVLLFQVLGSSLHVNKDVDQDSVGHRQRSTALQVRRQVVLITVLENNPRLVAADGGGSGGGGGLPKCEELDNSRSGDDRQQVVQTSWGQSQAPCRKNEGCSSIG